MAVYYRCKVCGEEHRVSVEFEDEQAFQVGTIEQDTFICPHTHQLETYTKEDMFWREDT